MRLLVILFFSSLSVCLSQTDSLFIEMNDGSIRLYPISNIKDIAFSSTITSVEEQRLIQQVISSFKLHQNYPNPFNPNTTIEYTIPSFGQVEINIFDIQGGVVRSLEKSQKHPGNHIVIWDGRNNNGTSVASGIYFCHVQYNGKMLTKKLALIK
ncbi:MAG: T9SS type A sorting domain-containing protein [Bacteroidetes bacterium]|nr:T9SS type A sorting domain-containing protein [Bacteroidota bacterium]